MTKLDDLKALIDYYKDESLDEFKEVKQNDRHKQ
jgi:hypothetical protein